MQTRDQFASAHNISLETYRRSGEPVKTTVYVVDEGGILYLRTDSRSGKAKRIRNNPHVRVAPSDMRGNVKGTWVAGEAAFLEGTETERVLGLFRKKYGFSLTLLHYWHRIRRMPPYAVVSVRLT